jgi:hypothetical protein
VIRLVESDRPSSPAQSTGEGVRDQTGTEPVRDRAGALATARTQERVERKAARRSCPICVEVA